MREIKFRAWWANGKEMVYEVERGAYLANDFQEVLEMGVPLMQFTGLKDAKGKEIWEGDIVSSVHGDPGNVAGFVKYRAFEFVVMRRSKKSWHGFGYVCGEEGKIYKVIGNIYENPELLEVK